MDQQAILLRIMSALWDLAASAFGQPHRPNSLLQESGIGPAAKQLLVLVLAPTGDVSPPDINCHGFDEVEVRRLAALVMEPERPDFTRFASELANHARELASVPAWVPVNSEEDELVQAELLAIVEGLRRQQAAGGARLGPIRSAQ